MYIFPKVSIPCVKSKGDLMHNSDAMQILNCALDNSCFLTLAIQKLFVCKSKNSKT